MKITKSDLIRIVQEELNYILNEKCWDGYEKKGMKTMFGKRVPNCVKKTNEEVDEDEETLEEDALDEEGLRDWFGKSKSKGGKPGWVQVVSGTRTKNNT